MPHEDIIVTFRNASNVKNIPLGGWYTQDVNLLCRKLVVKQININVKLGNFDKISDKLSEDLVRLH